MVSEQVLSKIIVGYFWKTFKLIWIKESKLDILKFKFLSSYL